jgi:transcriptional regulator NrdR family protein
MVCIYCEGPTRVINSRLQRRTNQVWRRRSCEKCPAVFTTLEAAVLETAVVVHNAANEIRPFIRELLFLSIYESCKHRPTALTDARELTQTVLQQLRPLMSTGSLTTADIAQQTIAVLRRFDAAASTMYGAFHPF